MVFESNHTGARTLSVGQGGWEVGSMDVLDRISRFLLNVKAFSGEYALASD